MTLACVGISHRTAPVELLERLVPDETKLRAMLARVGRGERPPAGPFTELAVLCTCNRVELYAVVDRQDFGSLARLLAEAGGVDLGTFENHTFSLEGAEVAEHLFRVASGLESMVLGEPQILGQVAEAHTQALRAGSTGLVLSHLFQFAIRTGKRARHETAIGVNPATVSSVAVHRIARLVPSLANAQVLVVGAGEMAELAVEALRRRSVDRLTVINRTVDRASSLADRWGARSRPFEALFDELAAADVVLTSTAAPHTIVHRAMVEAAMAGRSQRPMVVVDLAVPRDVEPAVGLIPGVHLLDIDELGREVSESVRSRESEVPLVEALIAEELNSFLAWYRTLEIRPVIKAMRGRAERIRQRTVKRALRRLPRLGKAERAEIELLTKALVNKLLHDPTSQLRTLSQNGQAGSYALLARELFGLREEEDTDSG